VIFTKSQNYKWYKVHTQAKGKVFFRDDDLSPHRGKQKIGHETLPPRGGT